MGDAPSGVSFQPGAGQPQEKPSEAGAGKGTEQYITREEALAMFDQFKREAQGYSDRAVSGFEKRANKRIAELESVSSSLGLSAEAKEQARQKIIAEELARTPETPAASSPAPQPAPAAQGKPKNPDVEFAERNAARLEKKYDIQLTEGDPEAVSLKEAKDVDDWIERYEAALQAKKQRVPPEVRIPTMVGTGGASPTILTEAYKKELLENRGKPYAVMHEIKEKWRAKGVDVDSVSLTR